MTDRELLEAAATAAGYEVVNSFGWHAVVKDSERTFMWRPLHDDGDALRPDDDVIDVLAIVLPDGTVLWTDDLRNERVSELIAAWKDDLPQERRERYEAAYVLGGFVQVRMLRGDFEAQAGRLA